MLIRGKSVSTQSILNVAPTVTAENEGVMTRKLARKMNPKLLLLLLVIAANADVEQCPKKCSCKRSVQKDGSDFIKLRCGEPDKVSSLEELELLNIASEIVHFNLSDNLLTTFHPKVLMVAVQKLDLSKNRLTELQNNQFAVLPNLRRLDLSGNSIKTIELSSFADLGKLERLKLNQNKINSIEIGTFDPLVNLIQLDISNNPLTCDCGLLWLLSWSQKTSVKLMSNPRCTTPPSFKGLPLRKLKIGVDIHCRSPAMGFPIIDMTPSINQVVFEGDSMKLQCRAPSISDTYPSTSRIEWTWLDSDPKSYFSDVTIETHYLQSTGYIESTLRIPNLRKNNTGIWNCLLITMQGNHSKGITIVVISEDTKYCPITVTSTNKGTYNWPRTVVNYTATIPCESTNLNYNVSLQKASHFCSVDGAWENLNTSMCSYISETTKILEQFSKVNSSIIESAKHFRNYTSDKNHFKDVMDVVFAIKTIQNYLNMSINQIGSVLMDVTNNLLDLPKEYLAEADYVYSSGSSLLGITEKLATMTPTSALHKSNIAVEIFPLKRSGFSGLKCTWYTDVERHSDRLFYCVTNSQTGSPELRGKDTEASITIPETLFQQLAEEQDLVLNSPVYNLFIGMHASNKLFAVDEASRGKEDVTSAVVGAKLVDLPATNLSDPVFVMLKAPNHEPSSSFTPVWWNSRLRNGTGAWSPDGCRFSHEYQDNIVFFCHNFGYYGLLQNITSANVTYVGAKFRFSHPAIYAGSFILFTSLLVAIVTYLVCYAAIQMPKKAKHSLINLWMSICFLCFMYAFGVYQTEDVRLCQIIGMLLHYFTLSSLLWICVGVNCMYKRLSKNDIMGSINDDELPSDMPIRKPVIGLYFVGWGVAIIVCGISAAININDYASSTYCFLRTGPPLSALYIPFAILLLFIGIFFLLIRCSIYNIDANGHLSEGTQATEHVDLDLLEPNFNQADGVSVASTKTASSEIEDPEHAPAAQLKAYAIFLVIYILAWFSCAFATTQPYNFVSFEEDLFSIAYAIFATILSAFTLFFYCVARSDVRSQWMVFNRWIRRSKKDVFRSRNVSDTNGIPEVQAMPQVMQPQEMVVTSRSSSRTSKNSHTSNILKAADLNGTASSFSSDRKNNVNLIVLHRQQYRSSVLPNIIDNPTNVAEVFYNPHQSIVARKFFKRQKRHMMKRNNLQPRAYTSDSGSVMSEVRHQNLDHQSIFGTSSKVNNTNIHSKHVHKKRHEKNLNIFSDDDDHAAAERKKKYNNMPPVEENMRSVSQQCTLEYSSENISDSILDKASPPETAVPKVETPTTTAKPEAEATGDALMPAIYVNPSHDLDVATRTRAESRGSSVLDELYQQIRKTPVGTSSPLPVRNANRQSTYFSDSDLYSRPDENAGSRRHIYISNDNLFENVESTV